MQCIEIRSLEKKTSAYDRNTVYHYSFCIMEPTLFEFKLFFVIDLLGFSASRLMRQIFSRLSKLGGTTNLIRLLFGHVK